ncbi:MAG: hypothetical protein KDK08_05395 [Rhizobiaceae bacterium]|nr:hypothetical protein [Rhizobiaceae bacterium]MCC0000904.1 hypothetical protein [Methylobacteriaceae bacterium]
MKIIDKQHEDRSGGVVGEIGLSFEANATAFFAQISGLAKDKISYPIRELSTNMWDASRDKYGDTVPEEFLPVVKLPTRLDPTISFRDFGNGMSKQAMETIYPKIYASTKRDSDTQVGGWGLGRLSAFAYLIGENGAGAYNIVSIYDGVKRAYTMSLTSDGRPVLRMLVEVATNEPSGMEISFAVRQDDIGQFNRAARDVLWSFNPRPKVLPAIEWSEPVVQLSGENWTKYVASSVPFFGPVVRMGCVMYPFDLSQIEHQGFLQHNDHVVFEAPIGSVSVNLSREQLGYDEKTKATLQRLVAQFETDVTAIVQSKVSAAETYFAACHAFYELNDLIGAYRLNAIRPLTPWNGRQIVDRHEPSDRIKFMRLREGWSVGADFKFDRSAFHPRNCVGVKIAIEHHPLYSKQRLAAAGLEGQDLLWIRVKRDDLAMAQEAIGDAEYVVLDDFKVETPQFHRDKTKKLRVRRTLVVNDVGFMMETGPVDLNAGGYFIERLSSNRQRGALYRVGDGQSIYETDLRTVLRKAVEFGMIATGTVLLIKTEKDELGPNWRGPHADLVSAFQGRYDPLLTPAMSSQSRHRFDTQILLFFNGNVTAPMPQTLVDIQARYAALQEQVNQAASAEESDNEIFRKMLVKLGGVVAEAVSDMSTCPVISLNNDFDAILNEDLVLKKLVNDLSTWGYRNSFDVINAYLLTLAELQALRTLRGDARPLREAA